MNKVYQSYFKEAYWKSRGVRNRFFLDSLDPLPLSSPTSPSLVHALTPASPSIWFDSLYPLHLPHPHFSLTHPHPLLCLSRLASLDSPLPLLSLASPSPLLSLASPRLELSLACILTFHLILLLEDFGQPGTQSRGVGDGGMCNCALSSMINLLNQFWVQLVSILTWCCYLGTFHWNGSCILCQTWRDSSITMPGARWGYAFLQMVIRGCMWIEYWFWKEYLVNYLFSSLIPLFTIKWPGSWID